MTVPVVWWLLQGLVPAHMVAMETSLPCIIFLWNPHQSLMAAVSKSISWQQVYHNVFWLFVFSLLQLVLPVLGHIKIPDSTEGRLKMFQFREKSGHVQLLLDFLLDVLLMPYRFAAHESSN